MNIHQLNHLFMVVCMMFAMSFGWSQSDSDDQDFASVRMRRQLSERERQECMDICMTGGKELFDEVSNYPPSERRAKCEAVCDNVAQLRATEIANEKEKRRERKAKKSLVQ